MAGDELSEPVRRLIRDRIGSASELEVLLLLRRGGERSWRPEQVNAELRSGLDVTRGALGQLAELGLLAEDAEGFRFAPRTADLRSATDALAEAYATRRTRVIEFLYQHPSDRVTLFADAFKFRRRR